MESFQRMAVSDVMDLSVVLEGEELSRLVFRIGLPMVAVFCENITYFAASEPPSMPPLQRITQAAYSLETAAGSRATISGVS